MKKKGSLLKGFITVVLSMVLVLAMGITAFATAEEGATIYVNTSDVNVRDAAGTSGNKVAVVQKDTALVVLGSENDSEGKLWYNVSFTYQGIEKTGWIRYDFTTSTVPEGVEAPAETPAEETDDTAAEAPADEQNSDNQMMDFTLGQIGTITPSEGDGEPAALPAGFRSVYVRGNGEEVPAWTNDEYYVFYAITSAGNEGWYLYDSVDGGYVRYNEFMAGSSVSANQEDTAEPAESTGVSKTVVIVMAIVIVLLVIASTIMGVKLLNNGGRDRYDDDDDEYDDDEEDEDDEEDKPARRSFFGRRRYEDDDDDEDEDEDDDDEDDDEDDEDYAPRRRTPVKTSGQVRKNNQPVRTAASQQRPSGNQPVRSAGGQVVRNANGQVVRTNGQVVRNANGQVVRTNGQVVRNANGQVVRTNGQVVRNANGQVVRVNGQVVRNANGQVVRTQQRPVQQRPYEAEEDDE